MIGVNAGERTPELPGSRAFAPDGMAYTVYGERTRQSPWAEDLPPLAEIGA